MQGIRVIRKTSKIACSQEFHMCTKRRSTSLSAGSECARKTKLLCITDINSAGELLLSNQVLKAEERDSSS